MRSWRSALDRIYYHNAYRVPPNYRPSSETEKALQDSLKSMELQCKERVDLLDALRESRKGNEDEKQSSSRTSLGSRQQENSSNDNNNRSSGLIGQGTIPAVSYPDLVRPAPPLPQRPIQAPVNSLANSLQRPSVNERASSSSSIGRLPVDHQPSMLQKTARTPSPEKRSKMKTTLRLGKEQRKPKSKDPAVRNLQAASSKAAGLAWDSTSLSQLASGNAGSIIVQAPGGINNAVPNLTRVPVRNISGAILEPGRSSQDSIRNEPPPLLPDPPEYSKHDLGSGFRSKSSQDPIHEYPAKISTQPAYQVQNSNTDHISDSSFRTRSNKSNDGTPNSHPKPPAFPSYRSEYPAPQPAVRASMAAALNPVRSKASVDLKSNSFAQASSPKQESRSSPTLKARAPPPPPVRRRPVGNVHPKSMGSPRQFSDSTDEATSGQDGRRIPVRGTKNKKPDKSSQDQTSDESSGRDSPEGSLESQNWEERLAYIKKHLPKGVDPWAAKQIFNEIVVKGDEVHWSDVAGLDQAKTALKEAVVYPFLRPDLFMGLREPARGMLLFGPPGTGKTMLARAVATESRSTFFAISASSLTSKWLGESEKLVRALFELARALAPSIIFVDEIDSLLSSRGGSSEHESTRRIKTEFLIQWSDLQRAAAGSQQTDRQKKEGDASRVLVLAATNLPWVIDEAARRRFVRRQYIPLPEPPVREEQLRTLLSHQKHGLSKNDIKVLVEVTDGQCAIIQCGMLAKHLKAIQALISLHLPKMLQWVLFEASVKRSCRCRGTRYDLSILKTSRRA